MINILAKKTRGPAGAVSLLFGAQYVTIHTAKSSRWMTAGITCSDRPTKAAIVSRLKSHDCPGRPTMANYSLVLSLVWPPDDDPPVLAPADDEAALVADGQGGDPALVGGPLPPHLTPFHQVPEGQQAAPTTNHRPKGEGGFPLYLRDRVERDHLT